MLSNRFLVLIDRRANCPEFPVTRLQEALCRWFPGTIIDTRDLDSVYKLNGEVCPKLVLVRSGSPKPRALHISQLRRDLPRTLFLGVLCCLDEEREIPTSFIELFDDHLCCPFVEADLFLRLRRLLPDARTGGGRLMRDDFRKDTTFNGLLGDSPSFLEAVDRVPRIAISDCTCLIEGATGTGKELFARAIHYLSPRRCKPFVPVNCGALPEHLIENELFGHVRGAYTNAASAEARAGEIRCCP
jgi:hypothetical protein